MVKEKVGCHVQGPSKPTERDVEGRELEAVIELIELIESGASVALKSLKPL